MGSAETTSAVDNGRPLSVALVTPGWPIKEFSNGIVTAVCTMREELHRQGHKAHVLVQKLLGPEEPGVYNLNPPLTPAQTLPYRLHYKISPRGAMARKVGRAVAGCLNRLAAQPGGVDLAEMEESFGWALDAIHRTKVPMVVRLHGPWFLNGLAVGVADDAEYRRRLSDEGKAIAAAVAVNAPSADVLNQTRAFYNLELPDAEVIHPPVVAPPPERHWRSDGCQPGLILFVGRFDRHKGGDTMIDAFRRVMAEAPEARLCFVGPDNNFFDDDGKTWTITDYLRERAPGVQESGRFEYLGRLGPDEIGELRRKAAMTVVASRYENLPMTVLEALACGSPLIATRTGGIPELVRDGDNGLTCETAQPEALAACLLRLLRDRDLAARLGQRAAESVARDLSPEVIARRTVAFYRRVLDRLPAKARR